MKSLNKVQSDAFWSKVAITDDENDCWLWLGAKKPTGYGNVKFKNKYYSAHRLAWELCNFKIADGFIVMHLCDNPSCCNPLHLVLGTMKSNTFDMIKKNRQGFYKNKAIGERNCNAKLTVIDVKRIRDKYKDEEVTQDQLAIQYGVTQTAISRIILNKTWRHV